MKRLLYLALVTLFVSASPKFTDLNVKGYGATGNGVTDDTAALLAALAAAHSGQQNLFFPKGTYLVNTKLGNGHILEMSIGGSSNQYLYGSGATIKTTLDTGSTLLYVIAASLNTGFTISGLNFVNTHSRLYNTSSATTGIFLQGTSNQWIDTAYISRCSFNGFTNDIGGQGLNGVFIRNNSFLADSGHITGLVGANGGFPCVDIWFFDNSNGFVQNAHIENNNMSGYTGTLPLNMNTVPRPKDGFLYGSVYGLVCTGNTLSNFSEEGISCFPTLSGGTAGSTQFALQNLIANNTINCKLPTGSVSDLGVAHTNNYAIRVDQSHTTVNNNSIKDFCYGIMNRSIDFTGYTATDFIWTNNTMYTPADSTTNIVQHSLYISGNAGTTGNVVISNNMVYGTGNDLSTYTNTFPTLTNNINLPTIR